MPRSVKYRCVESIPQATFFQPMGAPSGTCEEVEAIRMEGSNAGAALGGKCPKERRNSNARSSREHSLSP